MQGASDLPGSAGRFQPVQRGAQRAGILRLRGVENRHFQVLLQAAAHALIARDAAAHHHIRPDRQAFGQRGGFGGNGFADARDDLIARNACGQLRDDLGFRENRAGAGDHGRLFRLHGAGPQIVDAQLQDVGHDVQKAARACKLYDLLYHVQSPTGSLQLFMSDSVRLIQEYDQAHETRYMSILTTLVGNRFSLTNTANQLFIHKSTLTYHMKKMSSLFQIDWDDLEQMLHVQLTLFMMQTFLRS